MVSGRLTHLRCLEPAPGVLAWYDGRVPGYAWGRAPNWVDEGALSVGIASYAVTDGDHALVYDTHVSTAHAARIRADLEARGIGRFTVVLSHRHLDHVAGTAVFADCPVIANLRTAAHLARDRAAIESGTLAGPPAIRPLILPTETFDGCRTLDIGGRRVELRTFDIHSDDATVMWLPEEGLLLAGDTLEDTCTYVADAAGLARHLGELDRLEALGARAILPNHGAPKRIAAGGYGPGLIGATKAYIAALLAAEAVPGDPAGELAAILAPWLADGVLVWEEGYAAVHAENVAAALAARGGRDG